MKQRLPLALSVTALAVAVLGGTPLGGAAGRAVADVVPYAKKAGYARRAGLADNAKLLERHRASVEPKPGDLPVVGADGRLPASLGAVGPKGEPGEPATKLWAVVKADATLVASSGVVGVAGTRPYVVTFEQDISRCAILATPGAPSPQVTLTAFAGGVATKVEVHVQSRSTGAATTDGFSIAALC